MPITIMAMRTTIPLPKSSTSAPSPCHSYGTPTLRGEPRRRDHRHDGAFYDKEIGHEDINGLCSSHDCYLMKGINVHDQCRSSQYCVPLTST